MIFMIHVGSQGFQLVSDLELMTVVTPLLEVPESRGICV